MGRHLEYKKSGVPSAMLDISSYSTNTPGKKEAEKYGRSAN